MAKAYYLPADDGGKLLWLSNFSAKLGTYAATVGVAPTEVNREKADYVFFSYVCDARNKFNQFAQDLTAYKNAARSGGTLGAMPVAPVLGAAPALVSADIFGRATTLAARIKKHPGYTTAIGEDLNIIGAETVSVNTSELKPVLKLTLQAGRPIVGWKKQGMTGIELQVDRGQGFVFLAIDTVPDYTDTAALPAAGQAALWKYIGIYRQGDDRVGQWSDVVSLAVAGA